MLRKLNYVIMALLLVTFIAGRVMRRMPAKPPEGKKQVRLAAASWQIMEFPFEAMIEEFERRHPDIDVTLHRLTNDYELSLILAWKTGEPVYDLVVAPSSENYIRFHEAGLIEPIDAYMSEEFKADFIKAFYADAAFDAHVYGLAFMGEVQTLNHRSDILKAVGAEPPKTWEEVARVLRAIKKKGFKSRAGKDVYPIALDFTTLFFVQNTYVPMLRSYRGSVVNEENHLDLASPEAHRVWNDIRGWVKDGLVSPSGVLQYGAPDDFKSGIAAFFPHWQSRGLWAVDVLGKENVGIIPSPDSARVGSLIATHGGIIPKCSPVKREAAQVLIEGVCDIMQPGVARIGKMPVIRSAYAHPDIPKWMRDLLPGLDEGYTTPDAISSFRIFELVAIEFQKFLEDDSITAEQALAAARERLVKVYEGK